MYTKAYLKTEKDKSAEQIIESNPPEKAAIFLAFLPKERFDLQIIRQFLAENINELKESNYATYFRKLACLYDYFAFGWE